ncbi:SNF7 family protein [Blastomyces gilchristii SLH14081]|uniref:SNF7 family protein n=1 Tax=Blastomyces gilchristii (strain SLH14081) TaxID=559298 RepID=A0A179V243_BLAGS|nr:SNF7 family protein [Blastomyces gilchristii SLH14081]OAT13467.1 SNF7 family protein [Blastomyces gilchristii SLH14081]
MPPVDPLMKALMEVKMLASRSRKEAEKANKTRLSEENKASRAMKNREFQIAQIHSQSAVREHHRYVSLRAEAAEAEVLVNDLKAAYSTRERGALARLRLQGARGRLAYHQPGARAGHRQLVPGAQPGFQDCELGDPRCVAGGAGAELGRGGEGGG